MKEKTMKCIQCKKEISREANQCPWCHSKMVMITRFPTIGFCFMGILCLLSAMILFWLPIVNIILLILGIVMIVLGLVIGIVRLSLYLFNKEAFYIFEENRYNGTKNKLWITKK
jgi:DNA-directed RNA polymerase subunit RPC12/RpoP